MPEDKRKKSKKAPKKSAAPKPVEDSKSEAPVLMAAGGGVEVDDSHGTDA